MALQASGLLLRCAMLQNLIPSFPWIAPPRPPPWCNPRKGRDQILLSGNTDLHSLLGVHGEEGGVDAGDVPVLDLLAPLQPSPARRFLRRLRLVVVRVLRGMSLTVDQGDWPRPDPIPPIFALQHICWLTVINKSGSNHTEPILVIRFGVLYLLFFLFQ